VRAAATLALATALALGGCGQKGPLVLPDKNTKVVTRPAAAAPAAPAASPEQAPATSPPKPEDPHQSDPSDDTQTPH